MGFRKDFYWGASTASYQIEGAWNEDGKGPSVWDRMVNWEQKIAGGDTGNTACDHYHHLEEDIRLMKQLGINGYRFSLSWPRVLPGGIGQVEERGMAFYDRLIDMLLEADITPFITMFHWDYPLELYYRGGWLNPDSPKWFGEYAGLLSRRFSDRVDNWITLNEPQMFTTLGHDMGVHAPGLKLPGEDLVRIIHHVLSAHGVAVEQLRSNAANGRDSLNIGWAPAVGGVEPGDEADETLVQAARNAQFAFNDEPHFGFGTALWNDPVFLGEYPQAYLETHGKNLPAGWEDDMKHISAPLEFCGLNVYHSWARTDYDSQGNPKIRQTDDLGAGYPRTHFQWPVTPRALYWVPRFFHERYNIPVVITENGMSGHDWVQSDGKVHDAYRIDFTQRYLGALKEAAADGVDVRGYFHWSLMDNFEWAEGYRHRFGLVHVDFSSLKRTPKDSFSWYSKIIRTNGKEL